MSIGSLDANRSTCKSLLLRVKERDPEAWSRLVAIYGPLVLRWARTYLRGEQDAEDVVQDVFRSVFSGIDKFRRERPDDRFRAWLWTILRRRVHDHFRKRGSEPQALGGDAGTIQLSDLAQLPLEDPEDEVAFESEIVSQALSLVRAEFEERTWQACWRTAVEGESAAEAGEALGMSAGAVYVARSRVLRRLRTELEGLL